MPAIGAVALVSRALVLLAMAFWYLVGAPYDTSASIQPPCLSPDRNFEFSNHTAGILKTVVWDGVYYLRIARCGYEYEQMHAFQPLLPLLMRLVSNTIMRPLVPWLGFSGTLAVSGYMINVVSFVFAAVYLYKLSILVLKNEKLAFLAAFFFCINPASVFYSSIYSESLFAMLSFSGMWNFIQGSKWSSAILFGVSTIARSNGVIHAGFFLYEALHLLYDNVFLNLKPLVAVSIILRTLLEIACVITPFFAFQYYGYHQLCSDDPDYRPWCKDNLPYLYGFVQSHYWNVGFLRYFQFKQIPNFLSASPALLLATCAVYTYIKAQAKLCFSLGLLASRSEKSELKKSEHDSTSESEIFRSVGFFSPASLPFVFELLFMTMVAFFVMHVQVATRFLSSSPVVYWFAAHISRKNKTARFVLLSVFTGYILVGTLLFVNFYPFT